MIAEELVSILIKDFDDIEVIGALDTNINGISSLSRYLDGTLTWMKQASSSSINMRYTAVICPDASNIDADLIIVAHNPKALFFEAAKHIVGYKEKIGISPNATIAKSAIIGKNVYIGPYVVIGENVSIGDGCVIDSGTLIEDRSVIGKNCTLKANVSIGGTGFGHSKVNGEYHTVPHYGRAVIGDNVDIGCNSCVDRGAIDDTIVGDGVKIGNLCDIAHNVRIGRNTTVVGNTIICGSATVGEGCYIAPNAVIRNKATIGDGAVVGMGAVVTKDIPANTVCAYAPARVIREKTREDEEEF